MLIAMMAKTFDDVWESQALNHLEFHTRLVMSYHKRAHVPPPLSLPLVLATLIGVVFTMVVEWCKKLIAYVSKCKVCEAVLPMGEQEPSAIGSHHILKEEEAENGDDTAGDADGEEEETVPKVMWECTGTNVPLKGQLMKNDKLAMVLQALQDGTSELEDPTLKKAVQFLQKYEAREDTDQSEKEAWNHINVEKMPNDGSFIKGKISTDGDSTKIQVLYFVPYLVGKPLQTNKLHRKLPLLTNKLHRKLVEGIEGNNDDTSANSWRTSFKRHLKKLENNQYVVLMKLDAMDKKLKDKTKSNLLKTSFDKTSEEVKAALNM